jgi:signal transduction histidine kinase
MAWGVRFLHALASGANVKNTLKKLKIGVSRPDGPRLTLLLVLVVLAPSICLFWFMNRAVQNERLAVRQKLVDAYRGHLSLAQEKLDAYWRQTAAALDDAAKKASPAALFAQQVDDGLADAVIGFDTSGGVSYPRSLPPPQSKPVENSWTQAQAKEASDPLAAAAAYALLAEGESNSDLAAGALQSQARCLALAGKKTEALAVLAGPLAQERYRSAKDSQGRLLIPNAELMTLELLKDANPSLAGVTLDRLNARLMDYTDAAMSAPQRRFLMRQTQRLFPDRAVFSTLAAEDLAARYVEAGVAQPAKPVLSATSLPEVWQFGSENGRATQLHQFKNLAARLRKVIESQALPDGVRVDFLAPDKAREGSLLTLAASRNMPGWQLALDLKDRTMFDTATRERIMRDVWIGILVVAAVGVLAIAALRLMRRQTALTQLKNDLVANVTHELKTPLSSMRLLVDTLLNSEKLHEQTAREYLQLIAKENERLSRLIDNFLTFSRIERNKYAFEFKEVPAAQIAESAAASVRERFNTPGCQFEIRLAPDLPTVVADADAMVTALLNLLENAHKYSGEDKRIELSAGVRNGCVFFAVKDNGIGLSPRDMKLIFKRFYQVDQRLSRTGGGCGLGLSIVSFIATAHQGVVDVQSQPGCGSVFTLALPSAPAHRQEAKI